MTRILLTGKDGQVGWELRQALAPLGPVMAVGRQKMDLANPDAIRRMVRDVKPALIVNAGAYTAVDRAEAEPELAMAVNGAAPGVLAEEAKRLGALLLHYSTDYVFDGAKPAPYVEDDVPHPLNAYGRSKLAGEEAIRASGAPHLILRTSWVYGARGNNFLLTILRLARERDELKVVADQFGSPTWSRFIAETTGRILARLNATADPDASPTTSHASRFAEVSGTYHLAPSGSTSWYGFAQAIVAEAAGLLPGTPRITPIPSRDYPSPAARPANSLLSTDKLAGTFGLKMLPWEESLRLCLDEMRQTAHSAL